MCHKHCSACDCNPQWNCILPVLLFSKITHFANTQRVWKCDINHETNIQHLLPCPQRPESLSKTLMFHQIPSVFACTWRNHILTGMLQRTGVLLKCCGSTRSLFWHGVTWTTLLTYECVVITLLAFGGSSERSRKPMCSQWQVPVDL